MSGSTPISDASPPAISIITATYNRPAVLASAIASIIAQDFSDWELIVIGDHCSEATEALVSSFTDRRISYINLALITVSSPDPTSRHRAGPRQIHRFSQPGRHLVSRSPPLGEWLQATGADAVIARSAFIKRPEGAGWGGNYWRCVINGKGIEGRYDPVLTVGPASSLVLKIEAARAAGPWRAALDCVGSSSQQWLFRIWRTGADLRAMPHLTLVQIPSGSYVRHDTAEHEFFAARMQDPAALRLLLLDHDAGLPKRPLWRRLAKPVAIATLRALAHLGCAPSEIIGCISYGFRRGFFVRFLRRHRGLSDIERDPGAAALCARYAAERGRDEAQ